MTKVLSTSLLAFTFLFTGCEQPYSVSVSGSQDSGNTHQSVTDPSANPQPSSTPICTNGTYRTLPQPLRVLFMLDNSASTDGTSDPTDPDKSFRDNPIQKFLDTYQDVRNLSFNFDYFAGLAYIYDPANSKADPTGFVIDLTLTAYDTPLADFNNFDPPPGSPDLGSLNHFISINSPQNYVQPFGGPTYLQNALNSFKTNHPGLSHTHYQMAFSALQNLIVKDEAANPSVNYSVVFMSDGMPSEMYKFPNQSTTQALNSMMTQFNSAVSTAGHHVSVSTVYFGPEDPGPRGNLQGMVLNGGKFVDSNDLNGASLEIDNLITLPDSSCSAGP